MLKFLRRYQKWMLVVFCSGLMFAFVVPQALQQFAPNPGKQTIGILPDGEEITVDERRAAQSDLELLGSLGSGNAFGQALQMLIPTAEEDAERALGWLLLLKAAEAQGLNASQNEAFTLLATLIENLENEDDLERVATERNTTTGRMIRVARDFLIAEQYRQLITGVEFRSEEGLSVSPGLAQVQRINALANNPQGDMMQIFTDLQELTPPATDFASFQRTQQIAQALGTQAMFFELLGSPRISAPLLLNAVQERFSSISGQAVVLDAESYEEGLTADPERMASLFEQYKNAPPGTGEPMGFGYRIPDRVMLEAIRVPIDQVRELARADVTDAEVGEELRRNMGIYRNWQPPVEEDPAEQTPTEGDNEAGDQAATEGETGDESGTDAESGSESEPSDDASGRLSAPAGTEFALFQDESAEVDETEAASDSTDGSAASDASEVEPEAPADTEDETEAEAPAEPLTTIDNDPAKLIQLRAEIRRYLIEQRALELTTRIARAVREEMDKQVRSYPEVAGYRDLPADFKPSPLEEVAKAVSDRFSTDEVTLELQIIPAKDRWAYDKQFTEAVNRVRARLAELETEPILDLRGGRLNYRDVPVQPLLPVEESNEAEESEEEVAPPSWWDTILVSRTIRPYTQNQFGQPAGLGTQQYLQTTKTLRPERSNLPRTGLQRGVPSEVMIDPTGSNLVFRITRVDPAHAPKSIEAVEQQVREDAVTAQAYDQLIDQQEQLLETARQTGLSAIAPADDQVQQISNFNAFSPPMIEGVANSQPIFDAIIDRVETLREEGKLNSASDADRIIAVKLPREKKLVLFKISDFVTLSQNRLQSEARKDWVSSLAYAQAIPRTADPFDQISLEAIIRVTGFEYDEGYVDPDQEETVDEDAEDEE